MVCSIHNDRHGLLTSKTQWPRTSPRLQQPSRHSPSPCVYTRVDRACTRSHGRSQARPGRPTLASMSYSLQNDHPTVDCYLSLNRTIIRHCRLEVLSHCRIRRRTATQGAVRHRAMPCRTAPDKCAKKCCFLRFITFLTRSTCVPTALNILPMFLMISRRPIISGSTEPIFAIFASNGRYLVVDYRYDPLLPSLKGRCHGNQFWGKNFLTNHHSAPGIPTWIAI